MTSPILLVNLAGEMIYILNQRLKTQSLTPEKGNKIHTQHLKLSMISLTLSSTNHL